VQVTFADLHPLTATATVWRVSETTLVVPGARRMFAAGGLTLTDFWVPLSREVTYYAEMFNAAGARLGITPAASIRVWGDRAVWVMDPYDPEGSVPVDPHPSFAESLQAVRESSRYNLGDRVVALMGPAGLLEKLNAWAYTGTQEQQTRLTAILRGGLVLIRATEPIPIPDVLYASVRSWAQLPEHRRGGWFSRWEVAVDEMSPIEAGAANTGVPWQRYEGAFTTWGQMQAAYTTWLDAKRNPPGA
jgi:hypothetical protein